MQTTWNLDIFYSQESWKDAIVKDKNTYKNNLDVFVKKHSNTFSKKNAQNWLDYFEESQSLAHLAYKQLHFLHLMYASNTQDTVVVNYLREWDSDFAQFRSKLLFIEDEIKHIGKERLLKLSHEVVLSPYANYFVKKANQIAHQLGLEVEQTILRKNTSGVSLLSELHTAILSNATFLDSKSNNKLTESDVRVLRMHSRKSVRVWAHRQLHNFYSHSERQIIFSTLYYGIVKDWVDESRSRGYTSSLSVRTLEEEVAEKDIIQVLNTIEENYTLYHSFLSYKKKKLHLRKLEFSDVYALKEKKSGFDFQAGYTILTDAFSALDSEVGAFVHSLFKERRVDVFPRVGKQGGAFASYNKFFGQYILTNYTNDYDSLSTLAHEIGHAYHGKLSQELPHQVYYSPLVLAETASTFFELILSDYVSKIRPNLASMLQMQFLERFFATVMRQVQYVQFERRMHKIVWEGKSFGSKECSEIWTEEVKKLLGAEVSLQEGFHTSSWSGIPHIFHTPFYCFAYVYGMLVSLALYKDYHSTHSLNNLKTLLSFGGSVSPERAISAVGLDLPTVLKNGLQEVKDRLEYIIAS